MEIVSPETALQAAKREEEPCQGLKVHFGVVGCKGGGGKKKNLLGPEKFFQVHAFQPEQRPHFPPCQGLKVHCGAVLGLQRRLSCSDLLSVLRFEPLWR